jgi:hypothetical protein
MTYKTMTPIDKLRDYIGVASTMTTSQRQDAPPASPDNTPPRAGFVHDGGGPRAGSGPLEHLSTDRARLEAEGPPFNHDAPPDGEIGRLHELEDSEHAIDFDRELGPLTYLGGGVWSNGRHGRTMGDHGSVRGWRRHVAKPITPSPDAGIEAVKAVKAEVRGLRAEVDELGKMFRELHSSAGEAVADLETRQNGLSVTQTEHSKCLDELELQGRAVRRFVELLSGYVPRGPHMGLELARIEREERERNK